MNKPAIDYFNEKAEALAGQYNALDRAKVHADLLALLPEGKALDVLDVGAGSGADAHMFAGRGHRVVASEPAEKLLDLAKKTFSNSGIEWNADTLPEMQASSADNRRYDVVTAVGVLQYLDEETRPKALSKMFSVVSKNGYVEIQYPTPASREHQFSIPDNEVADFVAAFNKSSATQFKVAVDKSIPDHTGRKALDGSPLFFKTLVLQRIQ